MKKIIAAVLLTSVIFLLCCRAKEPAQSKKRNDKFSVLVFITGVTAGSPTYELLAQGAEEFAGEHDGVTVKVYEAGFNQAEWEEQLRSMVAGGEYDLVLGSNPSLPEICANVGKAFPSQKFVITDAAFPEGAQDLQICTYLYNQYEQALFLGYLAGLVADSNMPRVNAAKRSGPPKIGFIAAQAYPLLSRQIVPGFLDGARLADPGIVLDFRLVGNWYDANKAAELAYAMNNSGVDVFTSIAGGAAQGLVRAIQEREAYAVCFNMNEYSQAPGFIVGCGIMEIKKLVKEILDDFLEGNTQWGTGRVVGVKEGYLDFISDDPGYRDSLPLEIREMFDTFMEELRAGLIDYTVPPL